MPFFSYFMTSLFLLMLSCTCKMPPPTQELTQTKTTLFLPVDLTEDPQITVIVNPPLDFVTDEKQLVAFNALKSPVLQFIPKNESFSSWKTMISFFYYPDPKLEAITFRNLIIKKMESLATQTSTIYLHEIPSLQDPEAPFESSLAILQQIDNSIPYLSYMEYHSGKSGCSGLQYTLILEQWIEEKDLPRLITQIINHLDEIRQVAKVPQTKPSYPTTSFYY